MTTRPPEQPPAVRPSSPPGPTFRIAVVVAIVAVGLAVKVDGGNFDPARPISIVLLAVASIAGVVSVLAGRGRPGGGGGAVARWATCTAVGLAIGGSAVALCAGRIVPPSARSAATPEAAAAAGEVPMHWILSKCGFPPPADGPGPTVAVRLLLLAAGAAGLAAAMVASTPTATPSAGTTPLATERDARSVSGGGSGSGVIVRSAIRRLGWVAMPLALALHLAGLVAAIHAAPAPVMDVLVFQAAAAAQFADGADPYDIRFPDLSGGTSPHYGPGLQDQGELLFGYPYPPLSLFWLIPVHLAGGAVQYAHALGFTAAAGLVAYAGRGRWPKLAAVLFMLTPTGPLVVCYGWTETLVAPALALTVFVASRRMTSMRPATVMAGGRSGLLGVALGLLWASKQYVPLTAPLAWLLPGASAAKSGRRWLFAAGMAAAVSLPLVLWDVPAFWHSAVAVQFRQPFRPDALSFAAAAYHWFGAAPPAWVAFVALAATQGLALWRSPRTPAGFAAAAGTALLLFFAFNKQAFAGYYFLVSAAYACALAASGGESADTAARSQSIAAPVAPVATVSSKRLGAPKRTGKQRRPHAGV